MSDGWSEERCRKLIQRKVANFSAGQKGRDFGRVVSWKTNQRALHIWILGFGRVSTEVISDQ
jgi:hypothetical protein